MGMKDYKVKNTRCKTARINHFQQLNFLNEYSNTTRKLVKSSLKPSAFVAFGQATLASS